MIWEGRWSYHNRCTGGIGIDLIVLSANICIPLMERPPRFRWFFSYVFRVLVAWVVEPVAKGKAIGQNQLLGAAASPKMGTAQRSPGMVLQQALVFTLVFP